jgi:glycogen debranching enzyme
MNEACLGWVSEVFDADPPFAPGGAPAQAWSVAELLQVLTVDLEGEPARSPARQPQLSTHIQSNPSAR